MGLELSTIEHQYSTNREDPVPMSNKDLWGHSDNHVVLGSIMKQCDADGG
jgi:hypothetical protein